MDIQNNNAREKRQNFRVNCDKPLCVRMTIVKIESEVVVTSDAKICVQDISAGGFKFRTLLNIPLSEDILLKFKLLFMGRNFVFFGHVVRKTQKDNDVFEYGAKLLIEVNLESLLFRLINEFAEEMKREYWRENCDYCRLDYSCCLAEDKTSLHKKLN